MPQTDLEMLVYQMSADVTRLKKDQKEAINVIKAGAKEGAEAVEAAGKGLWSKFLGPPAEVDKALEGIFSRSRLAVLEEGTVKIPVFGSALEELGPAGLVAAAGLAAVGIAAEKAHEAMEYASDLKKQAQALGVTTTALQEFDYANVSTGVGVQKGREALSEFNVAFGKYSSGLANGKVSKFLDALGFTPESAREVGDLGEALDKVLPKLAEVQNPSQRAGIAKSLGLEAYLPVLSEGTEGVEKFLATMKEAAAHNAIISPFEIAQAAEMNEKVEALQYSVGQELKGAFIGLAPEVEKGAEAFEGFMSKLARFIRDLPAVIDGIGEIGKQAIRNYGILQALQTASDRGAKADVDYHQQVDAAYKGTGNPIHDALIKAITYDFQNLPRDLGIAPEQIVATGKAAEYKRDAKANILNGVPLSEAERKALGDEEKPGRVGSDYSQPAKPKKDRTDEIAETSHREVAAAEKAEIEARLALVSDLDQRAAIQAQLLKEERTAAVQKIADDLKTKKITAPAAAKATDLTTQGYDEKQALAERQAAIARLDQERGYRDDLRKMQASELASQADRASTAEQWASLTRASYERTKASEQADYEAEIRKRVLAGLPIIEASNLLLEHRRQSAEQDAAENDKIDKSIRDRKQAFADALAGYLNSTLQIEASLATNAAQRRDIERQILDIRQQQARQALQDKAKDEHWDPSRLAKESAGLSGQQVAENKQFDVQHLSPWDAWVKEGRDASADVGTSLQKYAVKEMDDFNTGVANAIVQHKSLTDIIKTGWTDAEAALVSYLLKQAEVGVLGGGLGSFFKSGGSGFDIGDIFGAGGLIPGFATGTDSAPGGTALVGEQGPELVNLPKGSQVVPNNVTRSLMSAAKPQTPMATTNVLQPMSFDLRGAVMTEDILAQINTAKRQAISTAVGISSQAAPGRMQSFDLLGT